jgi:hypothetical protein
MASPPDIGGAGQAIALSGRKRRPKSGPQKSAGGRKKLKKKWPPGRRRGLAAANGPKCQRKKNFRILKKKLDIPWKRSRITPCRSGKLERPRRPKGLTRREGVSSGREALGQPKKACLKKKRKKA